MILKLRCPESIVFTARFPATTNAKKNRLPMPLKTTFTLWVSQPLCLPSLPVSWASSLNLTGVGFTGECTAGARQRLKAMGCARYGHLPFPVLPPRRWGREDTMGTTIRLLRLSPRRCRQEYDCQINNFLVAIARRRRRCGQGGYDGHHHSPAPVVPPPL